MALTCTYPGSEYSKIYPLIEDAVATVTKGRTRGTISGAWTTTKPMLWVTTVSGLSEQEEMLFVLLRGDDCEISKA